MSDDAVETYAAALIRSIAAQMVDPHRYFEQRLLGELAQLETTADRVKFLEQMLCWLESGLLDERQRAGVDARLAALDLPGTAGLREQSDLSGFLERRNTAR
ncbi:MAG: hypothetical protein QNJ73_00605 [Gammaproteobacteria bacterium]|nr:hypothetical protein [Gammaproteobacteria bacterium]